MTDAIFNAQEIATLLKCTEERVAELLRLGELPGAKFGREWVVPGQAFFQRLNELALEEASKRRKTVSQPCVTPQIKPKGRHRRPLIKFVEVRPGVEPG